MASTSKKISLKSSDGEVFEVKEVVAVQSQTIKNLIDDDCASDGIPLPNVTGEILSKVLEYCTKHVDDKQKDDKEDDKKNNSDVELQTWDAEFIKDVDLNTLFDLILAANYLNIKGLLELTCQTVADKIKGKSPEEVREIFNIKNDFTPEEEAQIRRENEWAFQN